MFRPCFGLISGISNTGHWCRVGISFLRLVCRFALIDVQPHGPLQDRIEKNNPIYGSFHIYICSPMVNSLARINNQLVGSNPTTLKCNYQLKVCNKLMTLTGYWGKSDRTRTMDFPLNTRTEKGRHRRPVLLTPLMRPKQGRNALGYTATKSKRWGPPCRLSTIAFFWKQG